MNDERNISLELAASHLPVIPYIILDQPAPAVGENAATSISSTRTKLSDALDVADNDDYLWFNNSTAMFFNWTSMQDVSSLSSTADFVADPLSGYPYPSQYSWPHIIFASIIVTLIMLAIIFGNGLVVVAIAVDRGLRGLQNWFVASLAVSDLLVGLFIMPLTLTNELIGYWPFGNVICELWLSTDVLLCTASILNLCLISLDRYWSIVRPIAYVRARTPRRAAAMISVVWVLSMVICLPPVVGWKRPQPVLFERYPLCVLSEEPGYIIYSSIGSFYLPLIVMVLVYFKIYLAARERARRNLKKVPHGGAACSSAASAALEHKNKANNKAETDAAGRKSASTVLPLIVAQNTGSSFEGQSQMSDIRIEPDSFVDLDSGCTEGEDAYLKIVNSHHGHDSTGAERSSAAIDVSVAIVTKNSDDDEESGFMAIDLGEKSPKSNSGSTFTRVDSGSKSRPMIEYHLVPGGNISDNDNADELHFTPVDIDRNYLEITSKADVQTVDHHGDADSRRSLLKSPATESSGRCNISSKPVVSSSGDVTGKSQSSTIFNSKRFSISLSLSPNSALSATADGGDDVKGKQRRHSALAIPKTFFRSNSNSSQNGGSTADLTTGCGQSNLNGKLSSASDLPDPERTKRKLARARERRATVVLGIVMASFIGCWLPFFAIYPATALAGVEVPPSLFAVIFWLGYCNSALNPIIYTIFNRDFRAAFGNILCRARRRQSAAARGKRRSTAGRV